MQFLSKVCNNIKISQSDRSNVLFLSVFGVELGIRDERKKSSEYGRMHFEH